MLNAFLIVVGYLTLWSLVARYSELKRAHNADR